MAPLKKLGVECSYNPNKPEELHYSISIKPDSLKNPEQARKYFGRIINAVAKDASKKGGLDHLTLSINKEYLGNLQSLTQELLTKAREHKEVSTESEYWSTLTKTLIIGGAIAGGLTGLIKSYGPLTELATNTAENMNNVSHLWAPIAGLTQAGISILGTTATTILSTIGGAMAGVIISLPYMNIKFPLADKVKKYQSLEQALSQAEPKPKETNHYNVPFPNPHSPIT